MTTICQNANDIGVQDNDQFKTDVILWKLIYIRCHRDFIKKKNEQNRKVCK